MKSNVAKVVEITAKEAADLTERERDRQKRAGTSEDLGTAVRTSVTGTNRRYNRRSSYASAYRTALRQDQRRTRSEGQDVRYRLPAGDPKRTPPGPLA